MSAVHSVLIVGGGAIGCALARELAGRGVAVTVVERAEPGAEASSAAAGLIAPQAEGLPPGPLFDLALAGRALYPAWSEELERETGIDVGWRRTGILRCDLSGCGDFSRYLRQREAGLPVEEADASRIAELTAGLACPEATRGIFFPEDGTVDARRLTRALWLAAQGRGARFVNGAAARRFVIAEGRCRAVETDRGTFEADCVVDAAGAWAAFDPEAPVPVSPVRGQIVRLQPAKPLLPCVVESEDVYLVPRPDGSLLVGSTQERVGFRKEVTGKGVRGLLDAALTLVPSLADARFVGAWAGLRPASPDGWPILGASSVPGLLFATGHFRNGILLAPITATLLADAALGAPPRELEPFSAARFRRPEENGSLRQAERVFG